jgi:NADP-dependent 3-hydroxy acid dehydrogenase YdfG
MGPPAKPLSSRVGVVTGASSGIGEAIAGALADAGMAVMLGARRGDLLAAVCERIRARGGRADFVVTDMRAEAQVEALVDAAVDRLGGLDTLVNNAAVGFLRTIAEGDSDEWRVMLETNVLGTLWACRAALRHMLPAGRGDIVNVTSAAAAVPWPYLGVYGASKAAVHALTGTLRAEVAPQGLRVMAITMHNVGGTGFSGSFDAELMPTAVARWLDMGLLNAEAPLIEPADVARAVVFQLTQPAAASVHELSIRSRAN